MADAPGKIAVSQSFLDNMPQLTDPTLRREWDHLYVRDDIARALAEAAKKYKWALGEIMRCDFAEKGVCPECTEIARDLHDVFDAPLAAYEEATKDG